MPSISDSNFVVLLYWIGVPYHQQPTKLEIPPRPVPSVRRPSVWQWPVRLPIYPQQSLGQCSCRHGFCPSRYPVPLLGRAGPCFWRVLRTFVSSSFHSLNRLLMFNLLPLTLRLAIASQSRHNTSLNYRYSADP